MKITLYRVIFGFDSDYFSNKELAERYAKILRDNGHTAIVLPIFFVESTEEDLIDLLNKRGLEY